jgi:hypothetical protein
LLQQVSFAMAVHDIRYYLNGILFVADGKQLSLVATDGHRLAFASSTLDNEVPRQEVIDEMVAAQSGQTTLHNGHWARASTAVSLALLHSAHSGSPVTPDHQVAPVA